MDERETHDDGDPARPESAAPRVPHLFVVLEAGRPLAGGARYALEGITQIVHGRGSERAATAPAGGGQSMSTLLDEAGALN